MDGATPNGTLPASPMDVFSVNGGVPQIPAAFRLPPPKYDDVFPHEEPGQVAEMLKEPELYDSDEDLSEEAHQPSDSGQAGRTSSANPSANHPVNNANHFSAYSATSGGMGSSARESAYAI